MNGITVRPCRIVSWSVTVHLVIINVQFSGDESGKFFHPRRLPAKTHESNIAEHFFEVIFFSVQGKVI